LNNEYSRDDKSKFFIAKYGMDKSKVGMVLKVTCGNFLEMFDFFLFGFYATHIAATFFPAKSEFASLMMTFATFGAGFLMRPLGAIVLGAYVDTVGRRRGLVVTLTIMASGTLLIALVPGYQTIGMLAPLLVLIGRLLQGFSAGVELGSVSVYLSEMATPGHKGFYVSWQSASQQLAIVAAAMIGFVVAKVLSPNELRDWGWRIPFFIGCAIVPFLFYIRHSLVETQAFASRKYRLTAGQIVQSMVGDWKIIFLGMLLVTMSTASFYLITVYTPTFAKSVLHFSESDSLIVTLCIGFSNFLWLPISGHVTDRIGRRPVLLFSTVMTVLTAYPTLHWLVHEPTFNKMLGAELWLSFLYSSYNGAVIVALTEIIPERIRTAGFSLSYSLSTAIFGGFTAVICTWLIEATRDQASPGIWMSTAGACGLTATMILWRKLNAP
jgi:MHS family citrate/tricarballylate:H+ symporter-like MFS transporter